MQTSGTLYIVATPIGNLSDISERAIQILQTVNLIAAEDTRHSARLLQQFQIKTQTISLHDHNERDRTPDIIAWLQQGRTIALITDAGTPLLSDPGFYLVHAAREAGIHVSPIPGPCAAIAALSASGLPSYRFVFEGFLPPKSSARREHLATLTNESRTIIFYEAPHRIMVLLNDLIDIFDGKRPAAIGREMTKTFETFYYGDLNSIQEMLQADPQQQQGEFVVMLHGAADTIDLATENSQAKQTLYTLLEELPVKQAVSLAVKITGESKNRLYDWALEYKK